MNSRRETDTSKSIGRTVIRIIAILMIAGALIYLFKVYYGYYAGETEYAALTDQMFDKVNVTEEDADTGGKITIDAGRPYDEVIHNAVKKLMQQNSDMVCWIEFDNLDISYPVMHYTDNDFYLRRTFSKEYNTMGSIFMDAANQVDLEDSHTIIYGHNMRNLTMFGKLRYYKEEDFYKDNQFFCLYTDSETWQYQIFSCYDVPESSEVYTIWYTPDEGFAEFVNQIKKQSDYDTGVEAGERDKIITLSTCTTEGNRFILHAKRIEQTENRDKTGKK